MTVMEFNDRQTRYDDPLVTALPDDVRRRLDELVTGVPFIRALVDPARKRARDLDRDSAGRIVVDLAHPHILEGMDYFRPVATRYAATGRVSPYKRETHPGSPYMRWLKEELRRVWDGYVRPSDGEWVTGPLYWYLNYCPMMVSKVRPGGKTAARVEAMPEMWEGVYWRFHYLEQAAREGRHCAELAARGRSKSYTLAALLSRLFLVGESREMHTNVTGVITASSKEYLAAKDGTLSKFLRDIDFCATATDFPRRRLRSSMQELIWRAGFKDSDSDAERGTLNTVIGVSSSDDESKLRGKRAARILLEEAGTFPRLLDLYNVLLPSVQEGDIAFGQVYMLGCVCAGTRVWTHDGRNVNIEDLKREDGVIGYYDGYVNNGVMDIMANGLTKEPIGSMMSDGVKPCVRVRGARGTLIECSVDHPVLVAKVSHPRLVSYKDGDKRANVYSYSFKRAGDLKAGDRLCEPREIGIFGHDTLGDARFIGMMIGDGNYGKDDMARYYSEDKELIGYVTGKYDAYVTRGHVTAKGNDYVEMRIRGVRPMLRDAGILGQVKTGKRLPRAFMTLTREDAVWLLSGLYDTDGTVRVAAGKGVSGYAHAVSITQSSREILEQMALLWRKFGVVGSISARKPVIKEGRKDRNACYTLVIGGRENLLRVCETLDLLVPHKKDALEAIKRDLEERPTRGFSYSPALILRDVHGVEQIGERVVYNLNACLSHTYLANNIITHNTAGDSESDFAGMREIISNPTGYNMHTIPVTYGKDGDGRANSVFFFPGYVNRKGCYDRDGNSDVIKALCEILLNRWRVSLGAMDPRTVVRVMAETPITPDEAMMRDDANMFPAAECLARIAELDRDGDAYDGIMCGRLEQGRDGVTFKPGGMPIREYPLRGNRYEGAVEILEPPVMDGGKVMANRYIGGLDPVSADGADTQSLGSIFILDMYTDRIVAEYTGRTQYTDDFNETARLLCIYYNARCNYENNVKGVFSYFAARNSLSLLTENLEFLRDRQMAKAGVGNASRGTVATAAVNSYARSLLRSWLLAPVTVQGDDGEERRVARLRTLRSRALLRELACYNPDGNFDRISAMGMLMLLREDKVILYQGNVRDAARRPAGYLGDDPFFTKNYKSDNTRKRWT